MNNYKEKLQKDIGHYVMNSPLFDRLTMPELQQVTNELVEVSLASVFNTPTVANGR